MPGRSMSGFNRLDRHCLHHARSTVRCSASRMKGELHSTKNRLRSGLAYGWQLQWVNKISGVATSRDSNGYYYVTASWVPYHNNTTWCDHSPCAELGFSPAQYDLTRPLAVIDRQIKTKKTAPWWSSSCSERHILQHRCQPTPTQHIYIYNIGFFKGGGTHLLLALVIWPLTIDHASLSRRSTVPTCNRDTSNIWALATLLP